MPRPSSPRRDALAHGGDGRWGINRALTPIYNGVVKRLSFAFFVLLALPAWAQSKLPPAKLARVRDEMADVLVYLVRLADKLEVDLLAAVEVKMQKNALKYPVDKVRGSMKKYSDY